MIYVNVLFLLLCSYAFLVGSTNPFVKAVNGAAVIVNLIAIAIHFGV